MATIEERAKDFASHSFIEDGEIRTYINESEKESYLKGAIEQREEDIEKDELNFCIYCDCYAHCDARYSCETFEKFHKAMMEE